MNQMIERVSAKYGVSHLDEGALLIDLSNRLSRAGYREFCTCFNPLSVRPDVWHSRRDSIPDKLRPLVDLFLLSLPVDQESVSAILGDLIDNLIDIGLLFSRADGLLELSGLVLLPVFGIWLFCQRPQVNQTLYYGDDSVALLSRLHPRRNGRCLDLCAGPGIQALYASLYAAHVDAVEINPNAVALAGLNVIMNASQDVVAVHCGDLYEPIGSRKYDTISANPPLLPFPEDVAYPYVGHGGDDGLRTTRRILSGLPDALVSDGVAQIIGTCLSDGLLPLCLDELSSWAANSGMNVLMTVISHHHLIRGCSMFNALLFTATSVAPYRDQNEIIERLNSWLTKHQATHLCAYFLHITPGVGTFRLQDVGGMAGSGLWHI